MGAQSKTFLDGEGKNWLARNEHKLPIKNDPVLITLDVAKIKPQTVLEIGCSNGWRLDAIRKKFGNPTRAIGIDPFPQGFGALLGTADDLSRFVNDKFDLVIYGFCLYLCDREDLFKIAAEGDRVLKDNGYMVIYDFDPGRPHSREYSHKPGINSYKMDYSKLWLANPAYSVATRQMFGDGEDVTSVVVLKKNLGAAWPLKK